MKQCAPLSCLVLALLAAGCQRMTPQEQAAQDARDVAEVEAAQKIHPPVQPIVPEPIATEDFAEIARMTKPVDAVSRLPDEPSERTEAAGCSFRPEQPPGGAVILVTEAKRALLKVGGEMMVLAADSGSPELAPGLLTRYTGRDHWALLNLQPAVSQQGTVIVHDRFDRVVYSAAGRFDCKARSAR